MAYGFISAHLERHVRAAFLVFTPELILERLFEAPVVAVATVYERSDEQAVPVRRFARETPPLQRRAANDGVKNSTMTNEREADGLRATVLHSKFRSEVFRRELTDFGMSLTSL
jgi:hypothetical protein